MVPDDRKLAAGRSSAPDVRLAMWMMIAVFGLFILIGTTAGLVFNTMTIALPKVIDERHRQRHFARRGRRHRHRGVPVRRGGAARGRPRDREISGALVFAFTGLMQFIGVVWVVYATGYALLGALAFAIAFDLRPGDGQRFRHRPLHRRRLARPGLCGALLHHLS